MVRTTWGRITTAGWLGCRSPHDAQHETTKTTTHRHTFSTSYKLFVTGSKSYAADMAKAEKLFWELVQLSQCIKSHHFTGTPTSSQILKSKWSESNFGLGSNPDLDAPPDSQAGWGGDVPYLPFFNTAFGASMSVPMGPRLPRPSHISWAIPIFEAFQQPCLSLNVNYFAIGSKQ